VYGLQANELATFNRLIATGDTTATIANCKIGLVCGTLRHFAPQSLKSRCTPCLFRDSLSRHNRACERDLQRQSRGTAQLDRDAKNGAKWRFFEGKSAISPSAYAI
jgi:hypothetical protein